MSLRSADENQTFSITKGSINTSKYSIFFVVLNKKMLIKSTNSFIFTEIHLSEDKFHHGITYFYKYNPI